MKIHYITAVLTWITIVTATLESATSGNWSNEKEHLELKHDQATIRNQTEEEIIDDGRSLAITNQQERNFNTSLSTEFLKTETTEQTDTNFSDKNDNDHEVDKQQFSKQIVQPYILPLEIMFVHEGSRNEPIKNISRLARTSQTAINDTITVEYIPSQEISVQDSVTTFSNYPVQDGNLSDLAYTNSEEEVNLENRGEFGQRVRSALSYRPKSNDSVSRGRSKPLDGQSFAEGYRKQYRKYSRPLEINKLNVSNSIFNLFPREKLFLTSMIATTESQKAESQNKTEKVCTNADCIQGNKLKTAGTLRTNKEERKPKRQGADENGASISKDAMSLFTSNSASQVSLGKFTGPIVVADLPRQNKYSYATTNDYTSNDEPKSASVETDKSKATVSGYLATSSAILNPLQVGVALMNVGQDINLVNDPGTEDYLQDEPDPSHLSDTVVENETVDSRNSSFQVDQLPQQEQVSEVVASNLPTQSVEIQKSVEVFHTAPIHEIHYPLEFVPYAQQSSVKQRPPHASYKKLERGPTKDHRPSQVNVYRSNEVLDETISFNSQEPSRYEYNMNENDIVYSTRNDQANQVLLPDYSTDVKPVLDVGEESDDIRYNLTVGSYSRIQRIPDTIVAEDTKKIKFDSSKGLPSVVAQPPRIIDNLPSLANVDYTQVSQEEPQIFLTRSTNEPSTELSFLMTVPQQYPVDRVIDKTIHLPHMVNVDEKKLPYPVEKVIEKQTTIPQLFPMHVPVDRVVEKQVRIPYPVHVEKVIEKKVPLAIQRLIIPLPIHLRIPQPIPVPVEKVVEKTVTVPVPVPVPVEKLIEKTVHLPRPHPLEVEKNRPYPSIYNGPNDLGSFQQVNRQQNFQTSPAPPYGLTSNDKKHFNSTQFYGPGFVASNRPYVRQPVLLHPLLKKFGSYGVQYPHSVVYTSLNGNNDNLVFYGKTLSKKDKITDEYVGPVPRKVQATLGMYSKSLQYALPDIQATMRRTRQDGIPGHTGSFRQSKMEYGFKPPMVPSIQYDEQTATKID